MVLTTRILQTASLTPKGLYKSLLRNCEKLPSDASKFYKRSVRKEFDQHRDEVDKERVAQITERAVRDAEWILNKYRRQK